ncbi:MULTISPECIES: type III restriction-modification system endonuclease [Pseudomonas]|uniref:type III restriction-modification system endonuclease n=1 Tax=Pseudomonas TaxID=286 RepID=UPI001D4DF3B1|nr:MULTISPECIES: DEAD/DEAH box helicase family protein [Pseudomonas]MBN0223322.1 DEAD/DEAH box helicase family protein [Pseudomonas aeruginosa]MBN0244824.1 DEAD/DEAH box helicase family protein [Pseudomonas aeruginosa]MBN0326813.1 DEAD/DEAH box helicase family protein [Pseudomonas aeruginosa]MBN0335302.1 DEAD/DEAH box helicase family protein [Pseudomonas aeruginosa]MBN0370492.1 DEAD/DEAH box helicase family protein [Pseudomonas aeruginosa]
MKLHFEPNLDYQMQAIEAVCDLFRGQEVCRTEFTVTMKLPDDVQMSLGVAQSDLGVGNRLTLLDDELLKNLADIQLRGGLPPSSSLTSGDFTVEMETGTGKTYVYLRSIFELNKRYGFTKFVIVVPSVAIKEGVYKTLQITEEHFKGLYAGVPFDYFLYDSGKPGPVRNFATSSNIQIMVVTVGAINKKDVNNLYKESEKTGGEKPIDLIKATRPIIIVDEPQSVDGGMEGRGKEALDAMNPLCTLRYSATHVDKHHMVFRLDAVDAYERKLVKQIEVASATVEDAHNKPFVRLVKVENKRGRISAKIELDKQAATGVQRVEVTVSDGDDLQQSADGRAIYADFRVGEINTAKGEEFMELRYPGGEVFLQPGQAHGDVDALAVQREMIRRTIKEHLDKEKHLRPLGIKVLSLFFIDAVDKYRQYDADGQPVKGVYAQMFEEEYRRAAKLPAYQSLFAEIDLASAAEEVHNGYFSIDKKGGWTDTAENNAGNRENAERAYNLIMKEKEKLLSFSTPLKFIFSHSALKEGWDNPNVFQICTLRDIQTERERRQTIGRGLRLCVNQDGERVRGFEVNTLTVVATENYEQFAENLQKEIEKDTGIRFGIVEQHQFAAIAVTGADGHAAPLGMEQSKALWEHLKAAGHIDVKGKVQDSLKTALKNGTLELPAEFDAQKAQISEVLRKVSGRLDIKNADERRQVPLRKGKDGKAVYLSDEFKTLWDRIKHQTTYRVQFDNAKLVTDCIAALQKAPVIAKARLQWRKADISIGKAGVAAMEKAGAATVVLDEADIELPDLLTDLQDRTQLTRRTIVSILTGSGRLDDFKRNPQQFIELTAETINRCKRLALVDGIKYQKLGDQHIYAQELFEKEELTGYLKNMLQDTRKSIYEHVVYDSTTERDFADGLEKNEAIKLYAKLPGWFKVPTPLGTYNPDWAVLVEEDGTQHLYFVVETKSSLFTDDLRDKESAKIECGKAHFTALGVGENPARYVVARSVDDLLTEAAKG